MGEDECRAGDVADFAGAGGDMAEGAPAAGEQGERLSRVPLNFGGGLP
jgi:hypothetical protein